MPEARWSDSPLPVASTITSYEEFSQRHQSSPLRSVKTELTSDLETPVTVFAKLVGERRGFLLESVEQGERWSRYSFVGRSPLGTVTLSAGEIVCEGQFDERLNKGSGIFAFLREAMALYRQAGDSSRMLLESGLVGYLGYDTVREIEAIPSTGIDSTGHPDALFFLIGELVIFDHWRQVMTLVSNVIVPDAPSEKELRRLYEAGVASLTKMAEDLTGSCGLPMNVIGSEGELGPVVVDDASRAHYVEAVEVAKEFIRSGDIFQVVLSQRFSFSLETNAFELYRILRQLNPSPYMYFINTGPFAVVGASPEALVKVEDGKVLTRPIAGTRPRGRNDTEDLAYAAELIEHPKEIAEHVMLVDLARNDVGRIARFGSVKLDEFMTLERFSSVMHLTSQVSAEVREDIDPIDVLRATLPAGTLSGAPKVRAMEIIDALEPLRRGIYGGVVGYFDFVGALNVAITIRTAIIDEGGAGIVQAGAGIVADSDPLAEHQECQNKARSILHAVAVCNARAGSRRGG